MLGKTPLTAITDPMESQQVSEQNRTAIPKKSHVLAFTSGKGGVGKTCVTTNVAAAMAQRGARVCIFDADTGLANINILLGLRPEFTLEHVLNGEKTIHDVVITTAEGIAVVPGASGIAECANIGGQEAKRLVDALRELEAEYDFILIDTAAGVSDSVLQFIESAPCAFLVITSEPTSLTDAFSLLKLLNGRGYGGRLRIIVNLAADYPGATETYRRFASAVEKYLQLKVEYGGFVARDENVPRSVALQLPVVELIANSPASRCMYALADNVLKYIGSEEVASGLADYWSSQLAEAELREAVGSSGFDYLLDKEMAEPPANQALQAILPSPDLPQKLLAALRSQNLPQEQAENFISQFVSAFVEQYGGFPQSFRQLLYRWLEAENYAAPRLLELVTTLEALYLSRYQQPLFNLEDSAARLVAQTQGDETKLRELLQQLRASYRQSFHADAFDAQQEILDAMRQDEYTEERFAELMQVLREGFQNRFYKPYQGQSELLLETTAEALQSMAIAEKQMQSELEVLSQSFQQLTAHRDALLAAINNAQGNTLLHSGKRNGLIDDRNS